MIWVRTKY